MFDVTAARPADVAPAVAMLGEAFAGDPLMDYFFATSPDGVRAASMEFFSILLRARIALGMPAHVLRHGGDVQGLAMGYDTSRPDWPPALTGQFEALEARVPGLADRLAAYEQSSGTFEPPDPHYYLGVIGVHPSLQGKGAGRALIDGFCALSNADARSSGVYLETGSAKSLEFYLRHGFVQRGDGRLDGATLWCVFKPADRA